MYKITDILSQIMLYYCRLKCVPWRREMFSGRPFPLHSCKEEMHTYSYQHSINLPVWHKGGEGLGTIWNAHYRAEWLQGWMATSPWTILTNRCRWASDLQYSRVCQPIWLSMQSAIYFLLLKKKGTLDYWSETRISFKTSLILVCIVFAHLLNNSTHGLCCILCVQLLTLLHSEWPKLHGVLAILSAVGLKDKIVSANAFAANRQRQLCAVLW